MKKYIIKGLLFLVLFTGLVFLLTYTLERKASDSNYYRLPANVTTIIAGHSRPACAFNDSLIHSSVNLCNASEPYFYTYIKLRKIIKSSPSVRTLLVEFSDNNINDSVMNYWLYGDEMMLYEYPKYAAVMNVAEKWLLFKKDPLQLIKALPISLKSNAAFMFNKSHKVYTFKDMGRFEGKEGSFIEKFKKMPIESMRPVTGTIVNFNLDYLDSIIAFCRHENINVFFTRAPEHPLFILNSNEYKYDSILVNRYSAVPLIDLSGYRLSDDEYCDFHHINNKGSVKVSRSMDSLLHLLDSMPYSSLQNSWRVKIKG